MTFIFQPWQFYFLILADWVNHQQQKGIEYLRTENQVLREKLGKKRVLLNDDQRRRLAVKAKVLSRKVLEEMSLDYRGPRSYEPGHGVYSTDAETEVDFRLSEKRRPGRADLKWQALIRDGYYCRGCGVTVTARTSHADHIEPVHRFANFQQANSLDNIQTLCRHCHKFKTHRKKD